ncbi:DNA-binding domain-containing protein [Methylomonas koyamae]|uniref:Uncharacterized protein n=1 Tax=Methylomonas koyamae TaxID=702114 RepID=A0A291ILI6_9GAMM|nr:DNA-binding domain-containing protein [Methylomonas koyamae]ATG91030.1 hypothetical protein MKLM6_2824 [Methylomonas koyamae]OAI23069.1 hypothetical protein A1356_18205 [Methylomonas koyamae]
MYKLHELQRDFAGFVFGDSGKIPHGIIANGIAPERRLAVYRNNTQTGLSQALRDTYPVVNRLVGAGFFDRLARAYLAERPPAGACLIEFGADFPELIVGFADAASLPYLADVARLEWLCHLAYHAADSSLPDLTGLGNVAAADCGKLTVALHPSAGLIKSKYPLQQIWLSNQADFDGDPHVELNGGACRLLVFRPQWEVEIRPLALAEYRCLAALAGGEGLTVAVGTALAADPGFAVESWLLAGLRSGLIADIVLP